MPCTHTRTPSTHHGHPRTRHALRGLGIDSSLESGVLKKYDANRSGRLDILEFNKLVTDMRLEKDDLTGSQQAIRAPTADQPVPIGGYGAYGYGGGYEQSALPLPHSATADQPLLGGGRSAGFARDEPLGTMGSLGGALQTRPGLAPADQPLGLVHGRSGPAPQHRPAADEPMPIGGRSGFAPEYRPDADQPLMAGGRAGFAPEYRTGHRNTWDS